MVERWWSGGGVEEEGMWNAYGIFGKEMDMRGGEGGSLGKRMSMNVLPRCGKEYIFHEAITIISLHNTLVQGAVRFGKEMGMRVVRVDR